MKRSMICGVLLLLVSTAATAQKASGDTAGLFVGFTPPRCAAAPYLLEKYARRTIDSAVYTSFGDTLLSNTRDSIRLCQLESKTLSPQESDLLHIARVKLALGSDTEASTARTQYLAWISTQSARVQAWANLLIIIDDTAVRPTRIPDALEALERIRRLPFQEVYWAKTEGALAIAVAARNQHRDSLAKAMASQVVELWRSLDERIQPSQQNQAESAYLIKAEQALRLYGADAARVIIDSARKAIPVGSYVFEAEVAKYVDVIGKSAAPIDARFWFRRADTLKRPLLGRVTIVGYEYHGGCRRLCGTLLDVMNRLQNRFGAEGLEIMLITKTRGYSKDTAPVEPIFEALNDSVEILLERKLPGMLGVIETKYHWNIEGRRINHRNQFELNYPWSEFTIIDRNGRVRYLAREYFRWMEQPLTDMIERMLAERYP